MRGRPLVFLLLVLVVWSGGRVWVLLPEEVIRPLTLASRDALIAPVKAAEPSGLIISPAVLRSVAVRPRAASVYVQAGVAVDVADAPKSRIPAPLAVDPPPAGTGTSASVRSVSPLPGVQVTPVSSQSTTRWSGSAWAIARDGTGASLLSPLLGGAQGGVRIVYRLDDQGRVAMFGRLAAPLRDGPVELAFGVQLRPTQAPLTGFAEVRATRGQIATAVGVFGGGAVALPHDFRLEGYGQVGVIRRDGVNGFGDGRIGVVRPAGRIEVGAVGWAAAQRGAWRLDVGPSLVLPVALEPLAVRVALDWRHRIAGNARPASGPAVSLGADF